MTEKSNEQKQSFKIPKPVMTALKGAGITSLIGLVTFLSSIFVTQKGFSDWQLKHFYKTNSEQDSKISENKSGIVGNTHNIRAIETGISSFKNQLNRIESKQDKIIFSMSKR